MNSSQKELWERIQAFAFDEPSSSFPFSKKLQQENNWTKTFTADVIEEYRRFIFLCCILPGGASPSDSVDKVWHLHLTYTTNYWKDFCNNTLHKEIHHFPSRGGTEEKLKYTNLYEQTLEKYATIFLEQPPSSIWPRNLPAVTVKVHDIYDRNFFQRMVLAFGAFVLLFVFAFNIFRSTGESFLLYYLIIIITGTLIFYILQQHKRKRIEAFIRQEFPPRFNVYQVANFLYGEHRVYQTALVDLLKRDIIDTKGDNYLFTNDPVNSAVDENPLLPRLQEKIKPGSQFSYMEGMRMMDKQKQTHPVFEQFRNLSDEIDYQKFAVPGIVFAIGFVRLLQGLSNEKPINYLLVELGFFSIITLMIAAENSYTKLVWENSEKMWTTQNNYGQSSDVLNNFSIIGAAAIKGYAEYPQLSRTFEAYAPIKKEEEHGYAGSSCSSGGDSGSGCGGGCGGCGGGD